MPTITDLIKGLRGQSFQNPVFVKVAEILELIVENNAGGAVINLPGITPDTAQHNTVQIATNGKIYVVDSTGVVYTLAAGTDGTINIKNRDNVGNIFTYPWDTAPFSTWLSNLGTATVTADGAKTVVATVGLNLNNSFTYDRKIGVENFTIRFSTLITDKSSTSRGLMIATPASTGMGLGMSSTFKLKDTEGYIEYMESDTLPDGSFSSEGTGVMIWDVDDTIDFLVQKSARTFILRMTNRTNGSSSELIVDNVRSGVGKMSIYFLGDTTLVGDFTIDYDEIQNPELALMGDSIAWGAQASTYAEGYFQLLLSQLKVYGVLMAAPAEGELNAADRVEDVITVRPQVLIHAYGVNAVGNSIPVPTFKAQMEAALAPILAAGIDVVMMALVPLDAADVEPYNVAIREVASDNSLRVIEITPVLEEPGQTTIRTIYRVDGTHPNSPGHVQIANTAYNVLKGDFDPIPSFNLQLLLSSDLTLPIVRIDAQNRLVKTLNVADAKLYITNRPSKTNQDQQTGANINIDGDLRMLGKLLVGGGSGSLVSPYFSVNRDDDGYTRPVFFISQNFSTIAGGQSQFDGTNGGNYKKVLFAGGAYLLGFQAPLVLKSNYPATSGGSVVIDNDDENPIPDPTVYKILEGKLTGVSVFYVDGAGTIFTKGDKVILDAPKTPASATATGTKGTICWDTSFIYVCVATNTWKRVAIATW